MLTELLRCKDRECITKGWSSDKKYRISDENGVQYFLRISDTAEKDAKLREFERMRQVEATGIAMCRPIACGETEEGFCVLHSWVDGVDLEAVLPSFPVSEQYRLGEIAGEMLTKIHSVPAPDDVMPWDARFNRKMDRKIAMYRDCPLKYENGDAFLAYLSENRHLLTARPQSFQHGDYHTGNMMLTRDGVLTVIDFNRSDIGDPWEEFNRIVWCVQSSPAFASGMVDGYFGGEVPSEFWRLLALYISSNTLSSLPWAIPFGDEEIATMRNQAAEVLQWYDGMRCVVPTWYHSGWGAAL